ncbi:hypothetical protein, partial [Xanthomonas nasturtii]
QLHRNRPLGSLIDCRRSCCFVQSFPRAFQFGKNHRSSACGRHKIGACSVKLFQLENFIASDGQRTSGLHKKHQLDSAMLDQHVSSFQLLM